MNKLSVARKVLACIGFIGLLAAVPKFVEAQSFDRQGYGSGICDICPEAC